MSQSQVELGGVSPSANAVSMGKKSGLAVAGIASVLASACCIGPLVLASIGLGTVAASIVAVFEPLRPVLILIAIAALGFAGWRIYRRPVVCEPGTSCALPHRDRIYRTLFWVTALIVLALITFPYYVAFFY